jgi:hypothetical protein
VTAARSLVVSAPASPQILRPPAPPTSQSWVLIERPVPTGLR